jgi:hypothetical protein
MQDIVEIAGYVDELGDIVMVEFEVFFLKKVFDITEVAGDEVIHSDDMVSFREETVAEMRTKEARCARNQDSFHAFLFCLFRCRGLYGVKKAVERHEEDDPSLPAEKRFGQK